MKRLGYGQLYCYETRKRLIRENQQKMFQYQQALQTYNNKLTEAFEPGQDQVKPPYPPSIYDISQESMMFSMKRFFQTKHIRYVFEKFIPRLIHHNDGVIFTANSPPYVPGTCQTMMKWKPLDLATVDFECRVDSLSIESDTERSVPLFKLYVHEKSQPKEFGHLGFSDIHSYTEFCSRIDQVNYVIMECALAASDSQMHVAFDPISKEPINIHSTLWQFHKIRPDKPNPNALWVAQGVLDSIQFAVSKHDLIKALETGEIPQSAQISTDQEVSPNQSNSGSTQPNRNLGQSNSRINSDYDPLYFVNIDPLPDAFEISQHVPADSEIVSYFSVTSSRRKRNRI